MNKDTASRTIINASTYVAEIILINDFCYNSDERLNK